MKKEYQAPTLHLMTYQVQAAIANGSTVDGEFDLMDALSPTAEV